MLDHKKTVNIGLRIGASVKWSGKTTWKSFINITTNFGGNIIRQKNIFIWCVMGCNMSLKFHCLDSHLDFFRENLGAVSDEQRKRLYQDISTVEKRYQGKWGPCMLVDYCWILRRDVPREKYISYLYIVTF